MILAIGLAITAIFGESSLQSWVGWIGQDPANFRKQWFTKDTTTYQL